MLSVCVKSLPEALGLLRSSEEPLKRHSENSEKYTQKLFHHHKLVCLLMMLLAKALENTGNQYMSFVASKIAVMNIQEVFEGQVSDFVEVVKQFGNFSYTKVAVDQPVWRICREIRRISECHYG